MKSSTEKNHALQKRRVVVVGSLNMDFVTAVQQHPKPGETVLGSDVQRFPGGKGANQAAAAAKLGADVAMLGCVGEDAIAQELRASLRSFGADISGVQQIATASGMAFITVDAQGENMIVVSSGANRQFSPERFDPATLEAAAVVLMQLEIPLATVAHVAALARERGLQVMLNPAPAQRLEPSLLACLHYLIVNEGEAALLSGQAVQDVSSALSAAQQLRSQGVACVIVTLGGQGLVYSSPDGQGHIPACQVQVVDTTAAGDSFCGALAQQLAAGETLLAALRFANAAAALSTTRLGAQPSLPAYDEVTALLETLA